ncbi:helix-turn-helix domain-containing protein [Clostridium pasteurianum]|nr:helix-turn-helix domain-containing protein [Clostridium pasteurianum]
MSKFFTYEERLELQKYLKESLSFKEISRRLDKNPTTISREVRKNSFEVATGYICTARFRVPYVCNGCESLGKCTLLKNIYDAEHAHIKASEVISEARSGLCVSEDEIARLNAIISPLVQNGQSVHQIYVTHEDELMCSEKTIYNYIDASSSQKIKR